MVPTADDVTAARDAALDCFNSASNFRLPVVNLRMACRRSQKTWQEAADDLAAMYRQMKRIVDSTNEALSRAVTDHIKTANARANNLPGVNLDGVDFATWHEATIRVGELVLWTEGDDLSGPEMYVEESFDACGASTRFNRERIIAGVEREWAIATAAIPPGLSTGRAVANSEKPRSDGRPHERLRFSEPDTAIVNGKPVKLTPEQFRLATAAIGTKYIDGVDLSEIVAGDHSMSFDALRKMAERVAKKLTTAEFECDLQTQKESLRIFPAG
ncbi:MAG TPA: hypothetical protein VGE52_14655 [Pirellulales bacterium]